MDDVIDEALSDMDESEDRTPHRTHVTRHRRTFFQCFSTRDSCAPFTSVTSSTQE